jgi:hypothetical protein
MSEKLDIHKYNQHDHAQTYRQLQTGSERNTSEIERDFEILMWE